MLPRRYFIIAVRATPGYVQNNFLRMRKMKECFGIHFGFFFEDHIGDAQAIRKCYECEDFEKCYKVALIQSLKSLKMEIRQGVRNLRNSMGGSHSEFPFG